MFDYDQRGERATRDIVSRSIMDRIRQGFASPHGGVYIEMGHLGPTACAASSRAWSSAAPTAASISPPAGSR